MIKIKYSKALGGYVHVDENGTETKITGLLPQATLADATAQAKLMGLRVGK